MYQKNYTNYNQMASRRESFASRNTYGSGIKKAVKHFTDLEVYQKALEASVFVSNNICRDAQLCVSKDKKDATKRKDAIRRVSAVNDISIGIKEFILKNMSACALSIPHLIAEAHSCRFGSGDQCLLILDKVMLSCNKMVVYLEQTRDICATGLELEQFEEQIKKYFFIRQKVLNLQRVWRKYIEINKQEQSNSPKS